MGHHQFSQLASAFRGDARSFKVLPFDIFGRGLLQKLAIAVGSLAHVWA